MTELPMCAHCQVQGASWLWRPGWTGGYCSRECFNADDPRLAQRRPRCICCNVTCGAKYCPACIEVRAKRGLK